MTVVNLYVDGCAGEGETATIVVENATMRPFVLEAPYHVALSGPGSYNFEWDIPGTLVVQGTFYKHGTPMVGSPFVKHNQDIFVQKTIEVEQCTVQTTTTVPTSTIPSTTLPTSSTTTVPETTTTEFNPPSTSGVPTTVSPTTTSSTIPELTSTTTLQTTSSIFPTTSVVQSEQGTELPHTGYEGQIGLFGGTLFSLGLFCVLLARRLRHG